jgi:hypothetical protein
MSLAPILLMLGLVSGLSRGGRVANIGRVRFRFPALVVVGLTLQVALAVAGWAEGGLRRAIGGAGIAVLCGSYVLLAAFVLANRRLPGTLAIATGLLLNLAVIVANGGMPVSLEAARVAGIDPEPYLRVAVKHRELLPDAPLGFLGDVLPIPFLRTVVSIGDVVLSAGIFRLVDSLVRYRPRHRAGRKPRTRVPEPTGPIGEKRSA